MNRQVLGAVTALSLLMVLGAVSATAQPVLLRAHIPFDFYVGDKAMLAGDYVIETGIGVVQALKIWTAEGKDTTFFPTFPLDRKGKGHPDELVFKHYSDGYFLSSILRADSPIGQALPESRHEKALRASSERPGLEVLVASAR